jgi:HAD superfamily hydrolase (TIGR01509 family)
MNEYLKTRPVLQIFDHAYYSYELKLAKPHVEIYHKVQSLMGVEAKQIIFFDDKPDNVEGAISAGWNAYVFTDAEEVRTQLEQLECF